MNSQSEPVVEYRQSIAAILIYYVISFKFMLAMFTVGIVAILDYLNYKNTKLVFEPIFLVFVTGSLKTYSKEIPYEDIKTVRVEQSIIGKYLNYGSVFIEMKDGLDSILFKHVEDPESVRRAVQQRYVKADKIKVA